MRLSVLTGLGATVTASDPLDGAAVLVEVLEAIATTLTVRLRVTDSPQLLRVIEA